MIDWKALDSEEKVAEVIHLSDSKPQIILKHSISCPTSAMVKSRFDRSPVVENADYYLLDLWNYRAVSDFVAQKFGVRHESPQILIIHRGQCIYHESHYGIVVEKIATSIAAI